MARRFISKQLFDAAAACNADTFATRDGEIFVAQPLSNPDLSFRLRLFEVIRFPDRQSATGMRDQFSVHFEAAGDDKMQSGELCKIIDNETEWMILFVNPVIASRPRNDSNIIYEAAFS